MDISHKYPYTNFEQLNIDFLLESVADHSNKITQLRTDLTAETAARTADVEALTAEDAALTAFANAIQADLNTEISNREAISPVLFHLSYGQGGVLDCLPDETNDIMKAFDTSHRALVQFVDGTWYERINLVDRTTVQEAYFAKLSANSATWVSGGIIKLTHVAADDTHTFVSSGFSVNTEPTVIHITSSSNTPDDQATYTTTDDLWDVQFMDKNTYIELTCPGNYPTRYYTRSSSIISDVGSGSYSATFIFSYWDSSIRYDLEIALNKTDITDPSTWTATITGRKTSFDTV